jgi:tRNA pseudouridine38/39 synthase
LCEVQCANDDAVIFKYFVMPNPGRAFKALFKTNFRHLKMPENTVEALYAALFPGECYRAERNGELAERLRQVADTLHPTRAGGNRTKIGRDFDFSRFQRRYVALEIMYLGHDYYGFARQDSASETIEEHLFAALRKTRLIPADATWKELKYSRGGRTDKGVSALGQVVALLLRSSGKAGEVAVAEEDEIDYPAILNRLLPSSIRVLGWTTAPTNFSARFSAEHREYKYFIVDSAGSLDVALMLEAANHFVGEHDFRNFCKADVSKVRSFNRRIMEVRLTELPTATAGDRKVLELYIRGTAFLWHQVRCMVSVLLLVGKKQEEPGIIKTLLDVTAIPAKPQYSPASEEPLLFYSCNYSGLGFRRSSTVYLDVLKGLDVATTSHLVRTALLLSIEERLQSDGVHATATKRARGQKYVALLARPKEPTVEQRLAKAESTTPSSLEPVEMDESRLLNNLK